MLSSTTHITTYIPYRITYVASEHAALMMNSYNGSPSVHRHRHTGLIVTKERMAACSMLQLATGPLHLPTHTTWHCRSQVNTLQVSYSSFFGQVSQSVAEASTGPRVIDSSRNSMESHTFKSEWGGRNRVTMVGWTAHTRWWGSQSAQLKTHGPVANNEWSLATQDGTHAHGSHTHPSTPYILDMYNHPEHTGACIPKG